MAKSYNQNSSSMIPIYNPQKHKKISSKCFVYCFALFVLVFAILLVFSCIVILAKSPKLEINSVTIKSLNYDVSPSLTLTALFKVSIRNRNFGHFDFDHKGGKTMMSLIYGSGNVFGTSELKFPNGRVAARSEDEVLVEMKASSLNSNFSGWKEDERMKFSHDLNSGSLEFVGYDNFKGNVYLFKDKIKRSARAHMNCTIGIDLNNRTVQKLIC